MSPSGQRRSFYSQTEAGALKKAADSFGIATDTTLFGFYSRHYLPTVQHMSLNWKSQIVWAMDVHIAPAFGRVPLDQIERAALQRFFNSKTPGLKPTSIRRIKAVLSAVLSLAEQDELIPRNPVSGVRLPPEGPIERRHLSAEELHILKECSPLYARPFIILTGYAGLRRGEALGVTWKAIDKAGVLHVRQQVTQMRGACVVSEKLKTPASHRFIPLPMQLVEEMRACDQVSHVWACSDSKGGYIKPNNARNMLEEACEAAGIPFVSPHELRHTFVSLMENEIEAPRPVVQELAGHRGGSITDRYSHSRMEQKRRWMERLLERTQRTLCLGTDAKSCVVEARIS